MRKVHWWLPIFLLIVVGGGCASPAISPEGPTTTPIVTPAPTATAWPIPYTFDSPTVGFNIHIWWDRWASQRDWHLVRDPGFTWVKQRLSWQDVRPDPEASYQWHISDQIMEEVDAWQADIIFRLDAPPPWAVNADPTDAFVDLGAFEQFCYDVAERYQGRVRGYQIWNEPNLAREWGGRVPDAGAYVVLLRHCAGAIKRADPTALVITAGLAPTGSGPPVARPDDDFLVAMYEAGAAPYFDLLGVHAPGYAAPPETAPEAAAETPAYGGQRFFTFRRVEDLREIMVRYGDAHKQVALLEFGWTTDPIHPEYSWFAVTPEEQADYLVRALHYAHEHWSPWMGPMFIWNIPDPHWTPENEEFWWGIVDPFHWEEGATRPAYEALLDMTLP
jgi:hypothetical protein